ncbi:MAG TPA: aspartate carbamoyltransferase catalytic subunit [Acidimicrobiia bacterium]|nr:aspartate carbamoyltransferase catalytic subunit [Acidimicrobiia bacterium]
MKSLTGIRGMGRSEIERLVTEACDTRDALDSGDHIDRSLEGRSVANLFFEPSTRTRLSFDLAAQRLGAHVLTYLPESSSSLKGESLHDTVLTVAAIGADVLIVRHKEEGVPERVGEWTGLPVINAGDGVNEHPTQALLDLVTLKRRFGALAGLRVGIVGDIAHSRVAGSLIHAMGPLGIELALIGPGAWLPGETSLPTSQDLDAAIPQLDVVYLLRVQTERGGVIDDDYIARFRMDARRAAEMGEEAVIMHPGPINRGVEISDEVADSPRSLITEQVRNGVPTRMAVLNSLAGQHR